LDERHFSNPEQESSRDSRLEATLGLKQRLEWGFDILESVYPSGMPRATYGV